MRDSVSVFCNNSFLIHILRGKMKQLHFLNMVSFEITVNLKKLLNFLVNSNTNDFVLSFSITVIVKFKNKQNSFIVSV